MERKVGKEPRPVLVKFESQTSNNLLLENASKLKKSEVFKRVVLIKIYQRRTKKNAKNCCFKAKVDQIKGWVNKWTTRMRGNRGPSTSPSTGRKKPIDCFLSTLLITRLDAIGSDRIFKEQLCCCCN